MFWRQTPRETTCLLRGIRAERRRGAQLAVFTAWHTAALSRVDRLPDLAPLLEAAAGEGDADQSPEDQMNVARAIAASFGAVPGRED